MASPAPRTAAIVALAQQRKADSRARILSATHELVSAKGYYALSVEEILSAAGVGRPTFYRHFTGKADVAVALYEAMTDASAPGRLAIRDADWRDSGAVRQWIEALFAADRGERRMHQVITQALAENAALAASARGTIGAMIAGLGEAIPAFALDPERPDQRRRWLEAYMLLFEILDQSSHAALGSGVADDPIVIDILRDRFLAFVTLN